MSAITFLAGLAATATLGAGAVAGAHLIDTPPSGAESDARIEAEVEVDAGVDARLDPGQVVGDVGDGRLDGEVDRHVAGSGASDGGITAGPNSVDAPTRSSGAVGAGAVIAGDLDGTAAGHGTGATPQADASLTGGIDNVGTSGSVTVGVELGADAATTLGGGR